MNKPLVTVIIPTYNRAKTIERSINSVLSQSYSNLELIVVDDGSSDNTRVSLKILMIHESDIFGKIIVAHVQHEIMG